MNKKSGIIVASLASCALVAGGVFYVKNPFEWGQSSQPAEVDAASDSAAETTSDTAADAAETTTTAASAESETTAASNEGGGADAAAETTVFAVTVSEQKYLLDNQEISLDDLTTKLTDAQSAGEITVELTDNHGAVNAFDDLTAMLNEKQISYTVKETE